MVGFMMHWKCLEGMVEEEGRGGGGRGGEE